MSYLFVMLTAVKRTAQQDTVFVDDELRMQMALTVYLRLMNLARYLCGQVSEKLEQVNFGDVLSMIEAWGPCSGCSADINNDGSVNVSDLLEVVGAWGPC